MAVIRGMESRKRAPLAHTLIAAHMNQARPPAPRPERGRPDLAVAVRMITVTMLVLLAFAIGLLIGMARARAAEVVPGPVWADVVRVIDGDTLVVAARPWPDLTIDATVRLAGVDAPEMRGACPAESAMAVAARDLARVVVGDRVRLHAIGRGKYGRVVAEVFNEAGDSLADVLLAAGLARAYDGGRREGWCDGQ